MTQQQIDSYRDKIDTQLKEKVNEIESNISIIIIGALGFFLTINEKFISLLDSDYRFMVWISISALVFSFLVFIINKMLTTKYDRILIDFIDNEMKPDDTSSDEALFNKWEKQNRNTVRLRNFTYILLLVGIIVEVTFIALSYKIKPKIDNEKTLQIEIISRIDSTFKNNSTIVIKTDSNINVTHKKDSTRK